MNTAARLQPFGSLAPADVLGMVAHEMRRPFTDIETIAYQISFALPRTDERLQAQLTRIHDLVTQARWILSSGLSLAGPLPVSPKPVSLEELIAQAVMANGIEPSHLRLEFDGEVPLARLDPNQATVMIEALLGMSMPLASAGDPLIVRLSPGRPSGALLQLETATAGSEVAVSSLAAACARRIAEAHGGQFQQESKPAGGIRIAVVLP